MSSVATDGVHFDYLLKLPEMTPRMSTSQRKLAEATQSSDFELHPKFQ